jgi:hypothetical protein
MPIQRTTTAIPSHGTPSGSCFTLRTTGLRSQTPTKNAPVFNSAPKIRQEFAVILGTPCRSKRTIPARPSKAKSVPVKSAFSRGELCRYLLLGTTVFISPQQEPAEGTVKNRDAPGLLEERISQYRRGKCDTACYAPGTQPLEFSGVPISARTFRTARQLSPLGGARGHRQS